MAYIAFWFAITLVVYAHLGYAGALMAIGYLRARPVKKGGITPRVSFVIAARNEAARIRAKLDNTVTQDYPADALEIIVASDCSTDDTDAIVLAYGQGVRLVRSPERLGKESAQRLALLEASGDILVFSDVATALAPDAVSTIVRNFADPTVGCVSSVDKFVDADGRVSGEGAYVRYEMYLRTLETRANTLVGLSGSFFAARHDVCERWAVDRQSDFSTLLNAVDMGLRGIIDPESAGYYQNIADERQEFSRKVRTVARGLAVLAANRRMLNPFRYGLFAWQLASHKLCRWLVPFALIIATVSNAFLVPQSPFYAATFLAQCVFYAAALAGLWSRNRILRLPAFFVISNAAVLVAWMRFLRGDRITTWTPSERTRSLPQVGTR
jgi:glycosyltransferase involved in cell wall biosynthesis